MMATQTTITLNNHTRHTPNMAEFEFPIDSGNGNGAVKTEGIDTSAAPSTGRPKKESAKRPTSKASEPLPAVDLSEMAGRSYGEILLQSREALFETIATAKNLDGLIRFFLLRTVILSAAYGLCIGWYAWNFQILASAIKLPLLLLGTMGICIPALYAFNMFLGSKLNLKQTIALMLVANYVMAFFLAALSPILLFFVISTSQDKHFISLLNLVCCGLSGLFFLSIVLKGMRYLTLRAGQTYNPQIVKIWTCIYMLVGTQLSWLLRPFLGDPGEFVLFRALTIEGNFYIALFKDISALLAKLN